MPKVTQPISGRAGQSAFLWSYNRLMLEAKHLSRAGPLVPPFPLQSRKWRPGEAARHIRGHRPGTLTPISRAPF